LIFSFEENSASVESRVEFVLKIKRYIKEAGGGNIMPRKKQQVGRNIV
jgi:hypothetical protein